MKVIKNTTVVYKLELTHEEAMWLQTLMQNPLHADELDREDPQDRTNRMKLFGALKAATSE
jgi:hypothetical protein